MHDFNGTQIRLLGGEGCSDEARTMCGWIEKALFDTLQKGYLDKACLIMSSDEHCRAVVEVWNVRVSWEVDEAGREHSQLEVENSGVGSTLALHGDSERYTTSYVRKASETMMSDVRRLSRRPINPPSPDPTLASRIAS